MSTTDQLIALLRNGFGRNYLNDAVAFLDSLNEKEVGSVYQLLQSCIESVYKTGKAPCDWIQLVSVLLQCSQTRDTTFLSLIKKIQAEALPARDRFACTGELHAACLYYDMSSENDKRALKSLVKAILRPPHQVFSKSTSMQPSDACLALIDLLSTMVNGRRSLQSNHGSMEMSNHQSEAILLDFGFSGPPNFQSLLIDIVIAQQVPIPLIPALLSVLMESPLNSVQLIRLAGQVRQSLENHISSDSDLQTGPIALIPTWIQTSIIKACFFFSYHKSSSSSAAETRVSNSHFSNSAQDPSTSWISLLRFCMELSVIPWTLKSSYRHLKQPSEGWRSDLVDPDFDPSVVLCVLDLQLRQSFDAFVVVLNQYARFIREPSAFESQKRTFREFSVFSASDLLFLVLLLPSSTYQQPALRLLLEVMSRLVETRSMNENVQMIREMMEIPGVGPHSNLFVKLALHCVESTNVTRLAQLGSDKIHALHQLAAEMLCVLFASHANSRRDVLTLCFAPSTFFASEWHIYFRKHHYRNVSLLRDEFASRTMQKIASSHSNLLLPLTRLILDTLPYLTTSHPNNPNLCCQLLTSVLPLVKLDQDFQTQVIIFLRKLLNTRSNLECTIALSGISHLLGHRLVPNEVQQELFDILAQSTRLPMSLRHHLSQSVLKIAEKALSDWKNLFKGEKEKHEKKSNFEVQEHLEMAFQLLSFTRRIATRHWSVITDSQNHQSVKFQLSSFFESSKGKVSLIDVESTKRSVLDLMMLLTTSCNLYGAILERLQSESSDLLSLHWPLHVVGIDLLNTMISTMNSLGNVTFAVLEVLGVPIASISNLKRRLANIDTQYAALRLNLHQTPEKPESAPEYELLAYMIPKVASGLSLDSIPPKIRIEVISDTYCTLAEVLFKESRSVAAGNSTFVVVVENSALSLGTALTKAMFLLELRATMRVYLETQSQSNASRTKKNNEMGIEPKECLQLAHSLSIESILTILHRFRLPDAIPEGTSSEKVDCISFLPKPSLIAVYDLLVLLNEQLRVFRLLQPGSEPSNTSLGSTKDSTNFSEFASALASQETVSSLFQTCFSILQIINSPEDRQMLPEDVNLNATVEIIVLNQFECIRLTSDGCRVQLLGILESLVSIMMTHNWNTEKLIGSSLSDFSEIIEQRASMPVGTILNPKKRSRNDSDASNSEVDAAPTLQKRRKDHLEESASSAPVVTVQTVKPQISSGWICLYFSKMAVDEMRNQDNMAMVFPFCHLMTSLATVSRFERSSSEESLSDSRKQVRFACAMILQFLSNVSELQQYGLKILLSFVLDAFPDQPSALIISTALIELASASTSVPRQRLDPTEASLVDWIKNIPIHHSEGARDVALELALDTAFEISILAGRSFEQWLSCLPQLALILLALRKMAISTHATPTPRLWLKFLAICSKILNSARFQIKRTIQHTLEQPNGTKLLLKSLNGAESQAYFEEDNWAQEGWLTTFATFGLFLRYITQRLRSSFKRGQDFKIPSVLTQLEAFEEKCSDLLIFADRFQPSKASLSKKNRRQAEQGKDDDDEGLDDNAMEIDSEPSQSLRSALSTFQSLLSNCINVSCSDLRIERAKYERNIRKKKSHSQASDDDHDHDHDGDEAIDSSDDSISWNSEIESVSEDATEIQLTHRNTNAAYRQVLQSQNQFIDEALKDEEILFQDEDDYADLVDWIDTGDE